MIYSTIPPPMIIPIKIENLHLHTQIPRCPPIHSFASSLTDTFLVLNVRRIPHDNHNNNNRIRLLNTTNDNNGEGMVQTKLHVKRQSINQSINQTNERRGLLRLNVNSKVQLTRVTLFLSSIPRHRDDDDTHIDDISPAPVPPSVVHNTTNPWNRVLLLLIHSRH